MINYLSKAILSGMTGFFLFVIAQNAESAELYGNSISAAWQVGSDIQQSEGAQTSGIQKETTRVHDAKSSKSINEHKNQNKALSGEEGGINATNEADPGPNSGTRTRDGGNDENHQCPNGEHSQGNADGSHTCVH